MAKLVAVALAICGIAWLAVWLAEQIEIDSCLDSGGRYDHEVESCIHGEPVVVGPASWAKGAFVRPRDPGAAPQAQRPRR